MKVCHKVPAPLFVIISLLLVLSTHAPAASSTWLVDAGDGNWNNPNNWVGSTVPNGPNDTARFQVSNVGLVAISADTEVNSISFGTILGLADEFTIVAGKDLQLTLSGTGIVNNSGKLQTFIADRDTGSLSGLINFKNSASAGNNRTVFENLGALNPGFLGGDTQFFNTSSAGSATFQNAGSQVQGGGGALIFQDHSSATNGLISNGGSTAPGGNATTSFSSSSTAGNANITNAAGGVSGGETAFIDSSSAGSATIRNVGTNTIDGGGKTKFFDTSGAGSAAITNERALGANSRGEGFTEFHNTSSADTADIGNMGAQDGLALGGETFFFDTSTASNATIRNSGGDTSDLAGGGAVIFQNNSTAGHAVILNGGSSFVGGGGLSEFNDSATAGHAVIHNEAATAAVLDGAGETRFFDASTAGNASILNAGSLVSTIGGKTQFLNNANAGNATIENQGGLSGAGEGGFTEFLGNSSAGHATITNDGGQATMFLEGATTFDNSASAGSATIINNGGAALFAEGGFTKFLGTSDAGSATLIANGATNNGIGGFIQFNDSSRGGTARVEVFGNGAVDISSDALPVTVGSLEGSGRFIVGSNTLEVGSNNLSTTFSGTIIGPGGALIKLGNGTLALSGTNTYTGATIVSGGKLVVDGSIASTLGVSVDRGATLAGHGNVSGITGSGGTIAPGNSPGILTGTHVDPIFGLNFLFDFTKPGSPIYSNAAASGNAVLRLTDSTPFTMALSSASTITVDLSGASLAAGEVFRGGFFTDTPTATPVVSSANFVYLGTDGFTVNFDGFVTEPLADFAAGSVLNGTVLEFDIAGTGTSVPDDGTNIFLFGVAVSALALFQRVFASPARA